jgi:hypothetical protein
MATITRHILVRSSVAGLFGLSLLAMTSQAEAQSSFTRAGSIVVSAERLTGVYYNDIETEGDGFEDGDPITTNTEAGGTTVAFLGSGLDAAPSGVPRVGFDYFFMDSMSLGLSLTYGSRSNTDEISGTRTMGNTIVSFSQEVETTNTLFSIAPRFGYGLRFTPLLGLWVRGALAYTRFSTERQVRNITPNAGLAGDSETRVGVFGLAADAALMITPVDHVAFGVGPLFELSPFGDFDYEERTDDGSLEGDANVLSIGLSAGLSVWF